MIPILNIHYGFLKSIFILIFAGLANNAMDAKRSWTTKYEEDDEDEANADDEEATTDEETSGPAGSKLI